MYEVVTKKKFTLLLCSALLLCSSHVNAADQPLPPLETYKSKYIFVPGLPFTFDKWGSSASLEEIWDQAPDLQFQVVPFGAIASVGTTVAKAAISVGRAAGAALSAGVSAAGGVSGMIVKAIPTALSITRDVAIQQISAANDRAAASAENKAVQAQLITQIEADKALAQQQSDAALELEKLKQETAQKEAEEETKRVQLQAEATKKQAEEETKRVAAQAEAAKEIAKGAAANKAGEAPVQTVAAAKENLKEAAKKNVAADKELQQKVGDLVAATQKVQETAKQELAKTGAPSPAAFLPPQIGVGSQFTSAMETKEGTGMINGRQFQKDLLNEGKIEQLIGSIADKIQEESVTFQKAMDDLLKVMSSGMDVKDMGPQIKAVDTSWENLQALYSKNQETAKKYDEVTSQTNSIDYDNDAQLDLLLNELDFLSPEQITALFESVEEFAELEAEVAAEKEKDDMDLKAE